MKTHVRLLKICVTALFLWLLIFKIQWGELGQTFRQVQPGYVAASVAISFALVAASCWKWWAILNMQGHRLPFLTLYRWYFIGYFYTNFLPSSIGGDLVRSWLAGRRIGSQEASLVAVFAERFTGMVFLLLLAILAPVMLRPFAWRLELVVPAAAALAVLAAFAVLPFLMRAGHRTGVALRLFAGLRRMLRADRPGSRTGRLLDRIRRRAGSFAQRANAFFALLRDEPGSFWIVTGLTALFYALTVANVIVSCRAFGGAPSPLAVATVLPASLMVASLPITLGSLGLAEGAYVFYFRLIGISAEVTLAMALLLRLKIILLGLIGLVCQARERMLPPVQPGQAGETSP